MTTTIVRAHQGIPTLFVDGDPVPPIVAYVGPDYAGTFREAGVALYTFVVPGGWWAGPDAYDFASLDAYLAGYVARIPEGRFMPRIYLGTEGAGWWGALHPGEMNVLRDIATGEVVDQRAPNPEAVHYLGHEVRLDRLNLHSFHSKVWREDAAAAVRTLITHCEAQPYAGRIWAWHLADGLFNEWFHWNEYNFGALADYSPAAEADFRRWLRRTYDGDASRLSDAWGRELTFEQAAIPEPKARDCPSHGEFYDPVADRPVADYMQCMSDATVDSILAVCASAKRALPQPKAVCVFYGYQFSDMPRAQLNAHYALARLLASPEVDMIASPHAYSNRGEGGTHHPQAIGDAIRRAGKLHLDEIDCKTVWTPESVTWKRHISQPTTVAGTIEMMKKDAAYQLASATGQWWMDLTNQGWFDAPEAATAIRKLRDIEVRLQDRRRDHFGEIALVVSQRSMMFQAPREGLHNATQLIFRNWHLSRVGAPFETLLLSDLARSDLPRYKLYVMANAFYLSQAERELVDRVLKRDGATVLWVYAPGFLDDRSASVGNMAALTGMWFGRIDTAGELDVRINGVDHPITAGLAPGTLYGTGVHRGQYLQPPKIEYLPDTAVAPRFYIDDPDARVLGVVPGLERPGMVVKELDGWRSVYSSAPVLSWPVLQGLARYAGVHLYDDLGDMVWANNAFLAIYAQSDGPRTLRF
ncbi:MAG: beta-galactosidase, partial [Anaerolineae bacterium]|nr:beta-galactosidase [Anaerolineae bacterium]